MERAISFKSQTKVGKQLNSLNQTLVSNTLVGLTLFSTDSHWSITCTKGDRKTIWKDHLTIQSRSYFVQWVLTYFLLYFTCLQKSWVNKVHVIKCYSGGSLWTGSTELKPKLYEALHLPDTPIVEMVLK